MNKEEMIKLALAGLALWFITKGGKNWQAPDFVTKAAPNYMSWQFFTDGTSISPEGNYYHNGVKVYSP